METTTPFDLNRAIQDWRENLAQSPSFRNENLDELESHLRDSIASLQTHGLSLEEALIVAGRRIGNREALNQEFGKINRNAVWLERLLWILIGVQLLTVMNALAQVVSEVLAVLGKNLLYQSGWTEAGDLLVQATGYGYLRMPILAICLLVALWGAMRLSDNVRSKLKRLNDKPVRLACSIFILCTLSRLAADFISAYWTHQSLFKVGWPLPFGFRVFWYSLFNSFFFMTLTLFVARKRLRLGVVSRMRAG